MDPQSSAYHITGALTLKGSLDSEALRGSFAALVARHDSLRTLFREDGEGGATQEVQDESDFALHEVDLSPMPLHEREVAIENQVTQLCDAPFDLEQGPLLRVGLLRLAKEEHLLVVVMHHIVSDGWSIQLIINEFAADYCARVMGEVWQPTSLPIQYADYCSYGSVNGWKRVRRNASLPTGSRNWVTNIRYCNCQPIGPVATMGIITLHATKWCSQNH